MRPNPTRFPQIRWRRPRSRRRVGGEVGFNLSASELLLPEPNQYSADSLAQKLDSSSPRPSFCCPDPTNIPQIRWRRGWIQHLRALVSATRTQPIFRRLFGGEVGFYSPLNMRRTLVLVSVACPKIVQRCGANGYSINVFSLERISLGATL